MKRRFSFRRAIIILFIVFIYSAAICFISILAKKAILDDLVYPEKPTLSLTDNDITSSQETDKEEDLSLPNYYEKLEKLENKAEIKEYGIFAPTTTEISVTTVAPETEVAPISTTTPSVSSEPTTPKASETSATEVTTQKTTTAKTTKAPEPIVTSSKETEPPDVDISDNENETDSVDIIDDIEINIDDVEVTAPIDNGDDLGTLPQDIFDEAYIQSIIQDYYNSFWDQNAPQFFPSDVLNNGKSYADDIVTIYDKTSGRYVTKNAFDIVCEVTANEISASRNPEAIKAQAVAAYSYIKYYEQKGEIASLSTRSNVSQTIIDCVKAVDGLAMFYDDKYIMAAFSSSTSGVTCASENVWGSYRPYLRSVISEYDYLDTNNYGRITTYTADEVKKKIESKTNIKLSNNYSEWIRILSYADGGYVDKISIDGHTKAEISGKERELTAYNFRTYILNIRSTCFTVSYSNGLFTFVTYGYGHGVGMSQIGADLYAQNAGYTFDQILHHYYTDITIK